MIYLLLKRLVCHVLIMTSVYLLSSFVAGEWIHLNFTLWGKADRFFVAFLAVMSILASMVICEDKS